jgi:hypothetical protein
VTNFPETFAIPLKRKKSTERAQSLVEPLEQRIMFSADLTQPVDGPIDDLDTSESVSGAALLQHLRHAVDSPPVPEVFPSTQHDASQLQPRGDSEATDELQTSPAGEPLTAPTPLNLPDTDTEADGAVPDPDSPEGSDVVEMPLTPQFSALHIAFVDNTTDNADVLLAELQRDTPDETEWVTIPVDVHNDGVAEITEVLDGITDVEGIHILGNDEALVRFSALGESSDYAEKQVQWTESLAPEGHITLHTCAASAIISSCQWTSSDADQTTKEQPAVTASDTAAAPSDDASNAADVRTEIVFVYSGAPDADSLIQDIRDSAPPGVDIEVIEFGSDTNGIALITATLNEMQNVDAIHVISHGADGRINLGSESLNTNTLAQYQTQLGAWSKALTQQADLLFYGCDVAASEDGQQLIRSISALTGADVAASVDNTGHTDLDGDWELESHTGTIDTATVVSDHTVVAWTHTLATYTVNTAADSGPGSLRQAILDANTNAGADIIEFNIPGSGPHTIGLLSALPALSESVFIDGWSEPDYASDGVPVITIDAALAGAADGLSIATGADGSTVRGLVLINADDDGLSINSNNNWIYGNYVGLLQDGLTPAGNNDDGIQILDGANGNLIGTDGDGSNDTFERNIVGGNTVGVSINGNAITSGVTVSGNYIGVGADGSTSVGNTDAGAAIAGGADGVTVGGATANLGNVISGNTTGVYLGDVLTDNNTLQNNLIGTSADGTEEIGNTGAGILISAGPNTSQLLDNIIVGSGTTGIEVNGVSAGTNIQGNIIGTNAGHNYDWGSAANGILITGNASNTTIGGLGTGEGNTIAHSGFSTGTNNAGIQIDSGSDSNEIRGNSIYGSDGPAIDLTSGSSADGPDANDTGDVDTGGNNKQNWAILNSAGISDSGRFSYSIDTTSLATGSYTIDFYASSLSANGDPEPRRYLGSITTGGGGTTSGSFSSVMLAPGDIVSLVTTDSSDNSSEVSNYTVAVDDDPGGAAPSALIPIQTSDGGLRLNHAGGTDSYLVADDGASLLGGLDALTFEHRYATVDASSQALISYTATTDSFKLVTRSDGDLLVQVADESIELSGFDLRTLADGAEHTIGFTWTSIGGNWVLYVNGSEVDSGSGLASGKVIAHDGSLVIGNEQDNVESDFDVSTAHQATIYSTRLFDDVRTEYEIAAGYRSELPRDEQGLIANWRFDQLSANGVVPDTVSGNNLTLKQIAEPGFTPDQPTLTFEIDEAAVNGVTVGTVTGIDPERESQIAALLAADPSLRYSAETGKFYQLVSTDINWTAASSAAQSTALNGVSGQLVTIRSAAENALVSGFFSELGDQIWLGATDSTEEGKWYWQQSGADADQFWEGGANGYAPDDAFVLWNGDWNPDNASGHGDPDGEDRLLMWSSGTWNDIFTAHTASYVAEWRADEVLDATHPLTYSISSQTIANTFTIDADSGTITLNDGDALDALTDPLHTINIDVFDGVNTRNYSIDVTISESTEPTNGPSNFSSGIELNTDAGNDAYLIAADGSSVFGGLSALTTEVTFSTDRSASDHTFISYGASSGDEFKIQLFNSGPQATTLAIAINGNLISSDAMDYTSLQDGNVHTIATSWDNTNGSWAIYIDGDLVDHGSGLEVATSIESGGTLLFGQEQDSNGAGFQPEERFQGTLYDVRVWNSEKSGAELALNRQHKFDVSAADAIAIGLIANWQMELNGANQVVDLVSEGSTNNRLSVAHASGTGYISSTPVSDLHVYESDANGTTAGYLIPSDPDVYLDILDDGQFNQITAPTVSTTYSSGQSFGGWSVIGGSVDLEPDTIVTAPGGGLAVDLSGDDAGTILSNSINTVVGETYQVTFALNGNFAGGNTDSKTIRVAIDGVAADYTIDHIGADWINEHWEYRTLTFTASTTASSIQFQSFEDSAFGPYLADVSISHIPNTVSEILNNDSTLVYDSSTGKFYRHVSTMATWQDAASNALTETLNGVAGRLATIGSQYENDLVLSVAMQNAGAVWIGGSDQNVEGHWHWYQNTEQDDTARFWVGDSGGSVESGFYSNWVDTPGSEQPAALSATDDYALMGTDGKWQDAGGSAVYHYVIEWDASAVLNGYTFAFATDGDADGRFTINSDTGRITVADSDKLDYEASDTHDITVAVTDAAGNRYTETTTITIDDATEYDPAISDISSGISLNTEGGNSAYLITDNAQQILGGATSMTVEMSFAGDPIEDNNSNTLFSYETTSHVNAFSVGILSSGELSIHVHNQLVTLSNTHYSDLLLDGERHHIAVSWDNTIGNLSVYVDGLLTESLDNVHAGQSLSNDPVSAIVLGQEQDGVDAGYDPFDNFSGTFYDVRVWNNVRSAADISQHYQSKLDVPPADAAAIGLVANWQMDGLDGATDVVDTVAGRNLTIGNVTGAGFTTGSVVEDLRLHEHALGGAGIGFVVPALPTLNHDIVSDGNYTETGAGASWTRYSATQTIGDWTVDYGDVDLSRTLVESPPLGGYSIDMSGTGAGAISQTLTTEPGMAYQVIFSLSGAWDGTPDEKLIDVNINGETKAVSITEPEGWSTSTMQWEQRSVTFVADSSATVLQFASQVSSPYGAQLANVRVVQVPQAVSNVLTQNHDLSYDAATGKFYRVVEGDYSWIAANSAATQMQVNGVSGQLVTIADAYENELVRALANTLAAPEDVWIGASDQLNENNWYWYTEGEQDDSQRFWLGSKDGSAQNGHFANWKDSDSIEEPSAASADEDYARLTHDTGEWRDTKLSVTTNSYIVEWSAAEVLGRFNYEISDQGEPLFAVDQRSGELSLADPSPPNQFPEHAIWLDASDSSTLFLFGSEVLAVTDKSMSGNNANYGAAGPQLLASAMNGLDAFQFNGANDRLRISDSADINLAEYGEKTITVALQTGADTSTRQVVYEQGDTVDGFNLYLDGNRLYAGAYSESNNWDGQWLSASVDPDTSYVTSMVYDSTTGIMSLYLNGELAGRANAPTPVSSHSGVAGIGTVLGNAKFHDGALNASGAFWYEGLIAEISYNNTALTGNDVVNLHAHLMNKWIGTAVTPDFETSSTHTVTVSATGASGNTYSEAVVITVTNGTEPLQNIPGAQTINEDNTLTFNAGTSTEVSVNDTVNSENTRLRVELSVNNGTLTLSQTSGLIFVDGSNGSATMVLDGTESDLNAALDGMTFLADTHFYGTVALDMMTTLAAELDALYSFESNAEDDSAGTIHDGTLNGNARIASDTERGQVLSLDGSSDFVQVNGLIDEPDSITLAAWINVNDVDSLGSVVISMGLTPALYLDASGYLNAFYESGGVSNTLTNNQNLIGTGWRHVALTIDNASSYFSYYLDGKLLGSITGSGPIEYNNGYNTYIGRAGDGGNFYDFHGKIDDARIYSRALSAEEIAALPANTGTSDTLDIAVNAVNDDPVNTGTLPTVVTVTEDLLSHVDLSAVDFSDVDAAAASLTVTLFTATGGELSLAADANLIISGTATARTLSGPLDDLNNYFNTASNIQYLHATQHLNGNSVDTITVQINDNGNTGAGGGTDQILGTIDVDISAVNDEQVLTSNTGAMVSEGSTGNTLSTAMLQTTDEDHTAAQLVYTIDTLPVNGILRLNGTALALNDTFTQADIDAGNVSYDHDGSQTVADAFDFTVDDGTGTDLTSTFSFTVSNVNDTPENTVPGAQAVNEDTPLPISGITVADDDDNLSTVRLTVSNGSLNVTLSGSATVSAGANDAADLTLSGTIADINTTLASLIYQSNAHFNGTDTLSVQSTDSDTATDADTVTIAVNAVNDDPFNAGTLPTYVTVTEDVLSDIDLSAIAFSDVDASAVNLTVTLSTATGGELTLATDASLTFGGSATARTLTGSLAALNSYFNTPSNIQYLHGTEHFNGTNADTVTVVINDNGNTGTGGGSDQTLGIVSIDIDDVNDLPTTNDATSLVGEEDDARVLISVRGQDIDGTVDHIRITELPLNGTLFTDAGLSTPVTLNSDYATSSNSRFFYFVPAPDWNGTTTFTYTAHDDDGGIDASPATGTYIISEINDTPVRSSGAVDDLIVDEDSGLSSLDLALIDYETGGGNDETSQTLTYTVTAVPDPALGRIVLADGSTTVLAGLNYTLAQMRGMHFSPATNANGGPDTFSFTVADDGTTAGSADPRAITESLTITVNAVNDPPVFTANDFTLSEGQVLTLNNANISATDVESNDNDLRFTISNVTHGQFELASMPGAAITSFTQNQVTGAQVVFVHDNSEFAPSFDITVDDGIENTGAVAGNVTFNNNNDAPSITGLESATLDYLENDGPLGISASLSVADVDDTSFESATITISGNYTPGEDELAFVNTTNISGTFNAATGELLLTGSDSLAAYEAALQTVTYNNNSDNPVTTTRTLTIVVNDGDTDSASVTRDIDVTAVNDAPALASLETFATSYVENAPPAVITDTLVLSDPDDARIESATVAISEGLQTGEDILGFIGQSGISGTYDVSTGTLTLTGSASVNDYQAALRSVTYQNSSDSPADSTRTVIFTINDGSLNSNSTSRPIIVTAVNDAPELHSIESTPAAYTEDEPPIAITNTIALDDADNDVLQSAIVRISGNFSPGEDVLLFTDQSGITGDYDVTTGELSLTGTASVNDYQAALRTVNYENSSDNPATLSRTISVTVNDGTLDSNAASRDILLTAVNDGPVLSGIETDPAAYTENDAPLTITSSLTIVDLDDIQLQSATLAISGNFAGIEDELVFSNQSGITGTYDALNGTLTLSGTAEIADYESAIRSVTYRNNSDVPSDQTRTVTITVTDGDTFSNTVSRLLQITPVNDAPGLSAMETAVVSYTENGAPVLITNNLTVTDSDSTLLTGATVSITSNPAPAEDRLIYTDRPLITGAYDESLGVLTLNGTATADQYQEALRSVAYLNISDDPTTVARTLEFTVSDATSTSNSTTRDISLYAINDAPLLSSIEATSVLFSENSTPIPVTGTLSISDADDFVIRSATVSIFSNYAAGSDSLVFQNTSAISATFDTGTGVLTLTGDASVADYEAALRTVSFVNSSENPAASPRSIVFSVSDGAQNSNTASRDLLVIPSNDQPTLSGIEFTELFYEENTAAIPISSTVSISDPDDSSLESATIVITDNFSAGEDALVYVDQINITGNYDPATGTLVLTGSANVADYQAALRSVTYVNLSNDPSLQQRTIEYLASDGERSSNVATRGLQITAVNDNPVVIAFDADTLNYRENNAPLTIASGLIISDVDNSTLTGARVFVSENFVSSEDVLSFAPTPGISGDYDSASGVLSLSGLANISEYEAALRTVSYMNLSENPSTLPRELTLIISDAQSDSRPATSTLQIEQVNDAPMGEDIEVSFLEDTAYTITLSDLGFSDPAENHNFFGLLLAQLPANGNLILDGQSVSINDFISASQLASGHLVYVPTANANGVQYDQLMFKVVDDGGTERGGLNEAQTASAITFSIINVNDAPSGRDNTVSTPEDTTYVFNLTDFGFTDEFDENEFSALTVVTIPEAGVLFNNGMVVAPGNVIDATDIESGMLQYVPPPNVNGIGYNGFSFRVHDDGGIDNGGITIDPTENYLNFDVPGVNDPPLLIRETITVDEGSDARLNTDVLSAADADDLAPQDLTFTILSLPVNGVLTLDGVQVTNGTRFTLDALMRDALRYQHDGSETSIDFFDIQVSDGGEDGVGPATGRFSLIIDEVIDEAPDIADESLQIKFGADFRSADNDLLDSGYTFLAESPLSQNPNWVVSLEMPPARGTVTIDADGSITYQHDGSAVLEDSFSYRVTNEDGVYAIATVSVLVEPALGGALDTLNPEQPLITIPARPETNAEQGVQTTTSTENIQAGSASEAYIDPFERVFGEAQAQANQSDLNSIDEVATIVTGDYASDAGNQMNSAIDDILDAIAVKKHNITKITDLAESQVTISAFAVEILTEVKTLRPHDVVSNQQFLNGLKQLDDDFQYSEQNDGKRYQLANDATLGVSLSATAGVLAWAFRGGALFASAMASTPLWSSIDPVRVLSKHREDEGSAEDREVENYFANQ